MQTLKISDYERVDLLIGKLFDDMEKMDEGFDEKDLGKMKSKLKHIKKYVNDLDFIFNTNLRRK